MNPWLALLIGLWVGGALGWVGHALLTRAIDYHTRHRNDWR